MRCRILCDVRSASVTHMVKRNAAACAGPRPNHRRRLARPAHRQSPTAPPCVRRRIACARRCSIGCATRSSARAASICTPAPACSASRPCRAVRRRHGSSSRTPRSSAALHTTAQQFGAKPHDRAPRCARVLARAAGRALSTSCSSTRRTRSRSIRCSSCCRAWLAPQALVYVERPRSAGLPAVPAAEWLKKSYAGAVEYGLLRFEEATMPRQSSSEAHSP